MRRNDSQHSDTQHNGLFATLCITDTQHKQHSVLQKRVALCCVPYFIVMLSDVIGNVIMVNVIMVNVIMVNAIMVNVIMVNVIMVNVMMMNVNLRIFIMPNAIMLCPAMLNVSIKECYYAEYHYAE
jgi:hypothetical protein